MTHLASLFLLVRWVSFFNMKFLYVYFLFLCCISWGSAQNLISNPGFDSIIECPNPFGRYDIALAPPWESAGLSPDLFNTCGMGGFQVPYSGGTGSYQPAQSGGGYAGFTCYIGHPTLSVPFNTYREYIMTPLKKPLTKGNQYYLEFYVNARIDTIYDSWCYIDAVGLAFSSEKVFFNFPIEPFLNLTPAIENKGLVLSDTMNWMRVSGCYSAKGDEKFAILGNFRSSSETLVQPLYPDSNNSLFISYLFCDDVGVWEFNPLPDTILLCKGESKMVNASFLEASYTWSDGTTDSTFRVSKGGIYSVSADMGNCILSDTVVVIVMDGEASLPSDTLICQGEKIILLASAPGDYEWSTGSRSSQIEIAEAGIYTLTVTNECGTFTYESQVETEVCDCPIYVPNIFSPDGDGLNDELLAFSACDFPLSIKRFQVFDRWGNLVYSSSSDDIHSIRWDGLTRGKPVSSGVYIWSMEYTIEPKGQAEQKTIHGDITLLR